jgi:hypothetical protein
MEDTCVKLTTKQKDAYYKCCIEANEYLGGYNQKVMNAAADRLSLTIFSDKETLEGYLRHITWFKTKLPEEWEKKYKHILPNYPDTF